jgi:hypothetical protein
MHNYPRKLRHEAERIRRLKTTIDDQRTLNAIDELTTEYEANAKRLEREMGAPERSQRIRERAYRLWEEQGRPDGVHAEHWQAAEKELEEEERKDDHSQTERQPQP